ncbi:hypothetical protein ACET3Z_000669 [Daucus carota]
MLVGRKRSSRLIESSWVYNWAKKNPAFVTIDDDGDSCKALGIVSGVPCLRRKYVEACLANLKLRGPHQGLSLDISNERMEAHRMLMIECVINAQQRKKEVFISLYTPYFPAYIEEAVAPMVRVQAFNPSFPSNFESSTGHRTRMIYIPSTNYEVEFREEIMFQESLNRIDPEEANLACTQSILRDLKKLRREGKQARRERRREKRQRRRERRERREMMEMMDMDDGDGERGRTLGLINCS